MKKYDFNIGVLLAVLAAFFWAVCIIITKSIVKSGENPINVVFWVTIISLPFWIFRFLGKKDEAKKITKNDYLILISIAIIGSLLASLVEILALKYSQAVNYAFLIRSVMIFTIAFAAIFLKEKITVKKIILALTILVGAYLVATGGKIINLSAGDALTLLNAALIAFGNTILGKMATKTMSSELSSSGSFLFSIVPILILTFATRSFSLPHTIWLILLLSIIGIVSMTIRFQAYRHCSASFLAMTYSLTPVFVLIMAFLLFGERLTVVQLAGGFVVIIGGIFAGKLKV